MDIRHLTRKLIAIAVLSTLMACGGGDPALPASAPTSAGQLSGSPPHETRRNSLAVPSRVRAASLPAELTSKELLDWAEYKFPSIFPKGAQSYSLNHQGVDYTVRSYPGDRHLGVTPTGAIYGLGDYTNHVLQGFGIILDWAQQIRADECGVYPDHCNSNPGGSYNECVDPSLSARPAGFKVHLVYHASGTMSGEWTADSEVKGNEAFEGQDARRTDTTTSGSQIINGFAVTSVTRVSSFERVGSSGLLETLGDITEVTTGGVSIPGLPPQPGTQLKTRTVLAPAADSRQFTLAVGQSASRTDSSTSTVIESSSGVPPVGSVTTGTTARTWSFESKESITVPGGTFSTCRYRETSAGSSTIVWYIVGKGIAARSEATANGRTQVMLLKAGSTYNGAPL